MEKHIKPCTCQVCAEKREESRRSGYEVGFAQAEAEQGLPKSIIDEIREEATLAERKKWLDALPTLTRIDHNDVKIDHSYFEGRNAVIEEMEAILKQQENE